VERKSFGRLRKKACIEREGFENHHGSEPSGYGGRGTKGEVSERSIGTG